MEMLSYIWPSELILQIIIVVLCVVAIFVAYRFIRMSQIVRANLVILESLDDVEPLANLLIKNNVTKHKAEETFEAFAQERGCNQENSYVFDHVKNIFFAGFKSSHLEPELLVENTLSNILRGIDGIKSVISVFLVIGILGTLFGLAGSIGSFSGGNFDITGNTQVLQVSSQISSLFQHLRGAFAPSMWGVFYTIVFVLWFSWGIQENLINTLTERLMHYTIKVWVPVLYPTDFQRGENTMLKLNTTVKNAEGINKGVSNLQKELSETSNSVRAMNQASKTIKGAVQDFEESCKKIAALESVYEKFYKDNKSFSESIGGIILKQNEQLEASYEKHFSSVVESISFQIETLKDLSSTMVIKNADFMKIKEGLVDSLAKSNEANIFSAQRNQEIQQLIVGLSDKIRKQQESLSKLLVEPMREPLYLIRDSLKEVRDTNGEAAQKFADAIDRQYNRMDSTLHDVKMAIQTTEEIVSKIEMISNKMERLMTKREDEINKKLEVTNDNIMALCEVVNRTSGTDITLKKAKKKRFDMRNLGMKECFGIFIAFMLFVSVVVQFMMVSAVNNLKDEQIQANQKIEMMQDKSIKPAGEIAKPNDPTAKNVE